jgi:hypothetical protein
MTVNKSLLIRIYNVCEYYTKLMYQLPFRGRMPHALKKQEVDLAALLARLRAEEEASGGGGGGGTARGFKGVEDTRAKAQHVAKQRRAGNR